MGLKKGPPYFTKILKVEERESPASRAELAFVWEFTRPSGLRLRVYPAFHVPFQHIQRHCPVFEHRIMKLADIESRAKLFFGSRSQLAHLELPDLVRQRLTRPHDVAIHFDGNILIGF